MKKIYAGPKLAVVVLDSDEEIQLVRIALEETITPISGIQADALKSKIRDELLSELKAPAPGV